MAARKIDRRKHLIVTGSATVESFTSPRSGGGASASPSVDRARHGSELRHQLDAVEAELASRRVKGVPAGVEAPRGFYLEFESPPGFNLKLESLEFASAGVELVAARVVDDTSLATVYVPQGQIATFVGRVEQYLTEEWPKSGKPKHRALIENIAKIRLAMAESFWTDELDALPAADVRAWWEVWLRGDDDLTLPRFRTLARRWGCSLVNSI